MISLGLIAGIFGVNSSRLPIYVRQQKQLVLEIPELFSLRRVPVNLQLMLKNVCVMLDLYEQAICDGERIDCDDNRLENFSERLWRYDQNNNYLPGVVWNDGEITFSMYMEDANGNIRFLVLDGNDDEYWDLDELYAKDIDLLSFAWDLRNCAMLLQDQKDFPETEYLELKTKVKKYSELALEALILKK